MFVDPDMSVDGVAVGDIRNYRVLFCPCTICGSVAELRHMQKIYQRIASVTNQSVRCTKMVICVERGNVWRCFITYYWRWLPLTRDRACALLLRCNGFNGTGT